MSIFAAAKSGEKTGRKELWLKQFFFKIFQKDLRSYIFDMFFFKKSYAHNFFWKTFYLYNFRRIWSLQLVGIITGSTYLVRVLEDFCSEFHKKMMPRPKTDSFVLVFEFWRQTLTLKWIPFNFAGIHNFVSEFCSQLFFLSMDPTVFHQWILQTYSLPGLTSIDQKC